MLTRLPNPPAIPKNPFTVLSRSVGSVATGGDAHVWGAGAESWVARAMLNASRLTGGVGLAVFADRCQGH